MSATRFNMLWGLRRRCGTIVAVETTNGANDLSRSLVAFDRAKHDLSVIELGLRAWLVVGLVPGLTRQRLKKLGPEAEALLTLLRRRQGEATTASSTINRTVVAFEAGPDGFWS